MAGLKLQIGLAAADKISKPFKNARRSTDDLRSAMSEATGKVRNLERTAADLDAFRRLKAKARDNARALDEAQNRVDALAREMASANKVTKKTRSEFSAAKNRRHGYARKWMRTRSRPMSYAVG